MPKKLKLYLDTSVISALVAEKQHWQREATEELFYAIENRKHLAYISELVLDEILATPNSERRSRLLLIIDTYRLQQLPITVESRKLAKEYILRKLIPARYEPDALHIAIATLSQVDVLMSWNFRHIVKHSTAIGVNRINVTLGYATIDIRSPQEV